MAKRQRGFLTFAQNNPTCDYIWHAYALALSIRATQKDVPYLSIAVTPGTKIYKRYNIFDEIIEIPWGDPTEFSDIKFENEWKAYHITPYEETIKLDADMLFLSDVSHWWDNNNLFPVRICNTVNTFRGETGTSTFYRQDHIQNNIPNLYSGAMYFRKDDKAKLFFKIVEDIFTDWEAYAKTFMPKETPKLATTDTVVSLAAYILNWIDVINDKNSLTFTHMKSKINWTNVRDFSWRCYAPYQLTDKLELYIGNFKQEGLFHYVDKGFLTEAICNKYEKFLHLSR
jgi:hypothetical protein